ncbi:MAG: SusD/RagB family nutrient-binding outer membrane lipoprotein [Bacteroidetes bacterium]|nr:SusD/RagB family nutrient-binding outer membrane lipoprotein [Bacteroidota bacterium]MBS1541034.1 SusD/RagB family nutrient-binding outer membrane lipoprotein [Bacteroidota bacterium]
MKKIKLNILLVCVCLLVLSSCSSFLDINHNPNQPTSLGTPDYILTGAIVASGQIQAVDLASFSGYWAGYWAASGSYSQAGDLTRNYNLTFNWLPYGVNATFAGTEPSQQLQAWALLFNNASNYNYAEHNAKNLKNYDYYQAIAKIMKVWCFHSLVDVYGNVPYTSAFGGLGNLVPSYDDAQTVYKNLSLQLDSAVTIIQNAPATVVNVNPHTDAIFGGNMSSWVAMANTLNLRLLLRQSEVTTAATQTFIQQELTKINANGGGFLGAGQDALIQPGYTKIQDLQNPFWENNGLSAANAIGGRDYNRISNFSLNFFLNNNDPRADYLFRLPGDAPGVNSKLTGNSAAYAGIDFGELPLTADATPYTSSFGIGVLGGPSQPLPFITAAESLFLQAEAAQRTWISGSPQTFFESGITESFRYLGVPNYAAAASTYYGQPLADVNWGASSTNLMHAIITQKWAAMTSINCMEAWCDIRRLINTPSGVSVPLSIDPTVTSTVAPVRLLYPLSEYSNNAAAVNAQGTISQFTSKIFWDVH